MRRTPRNLADAREELVQIQAEFTRLQQRIEAVRDCVTDSLVRFLGEQRPAFAGLKEEALIERIVGRVVARLNIATKSQPTADRKYVREKEAARFLGVSVSALRDWRSRRPPSGPPVTKLDKMVMYSVKELERYMEERTAEGGNGAGGTSRVLGHSGRRQRLWRDCSASEHQPQGAGTAFGEDKE